MIYKFFLQNNAAFCAQRIKNQKPCIVFSSLLFLFFFISKKNIQLQLTQQ